MIHAEPAAVAQPPAAPEVLVVSRDDRSEIVAILDTPLVLVKAGRREAMLLRRAVFITSSVTVVRPRSATGSEADRYRWAYQGFLQRQFCVTSITGLFSCTVPQVESLPDAQKGEAALAAPTSGEAFPAAAAAQGRITESLRARATALFDADRRANVDPVFKAAGVAVATAAPRR
jgi:hypothetical protein